MDIGYEFQASASADLSATRSMDFGNRSTVDGTLRKRGETSSQRTYVAAHLWSNGCPDKHSHAARNDCSESDVGLEINMMVC